MGIRNINCRGCDSKIKKSVKAGGAWEKKHPKILVLQYWNSIFLGGEEMGGGMLRWITQIL